jgi:hypothetical protein
MTTFTPSEEQLVIELNQTFLPPKIFDDTRISFGTPTAVTASDHDTEVVATGIPGRGYYGTALIKYTRVNLAALTGLVTLYSLNDFTLDVVCSMMNSQLGTFLAPVDFQPPTFPTIGAGSSATVTLVADPSSIGWTGQVDIVLTHDKPRLDQVVGVKSLIPLKWPTWPYVNGRDFLWNIDFTSYRDAIKPTLQPMWPLPAPGGWGFADYASLIDVCTRIGVPWFPNTGWTNQVSDNATSQVADSNQSFDRVVVMGYVPAGKFYPGPLYLHYKTFDKV